MAVEVFAVELRPIVPEHADHERDDADADERHLHDAVHEEGDAAGEVEAVDGQPEQRGDEQWSYDASVLRIETGCEIVLAMLFGRSVG